MSPMQLQGLLHFSEGQSPLPPASRGASPVQLASLYVAPSDPTCNPLSSVGNRRRPLSDDVLALEPVVVAPTGACRDGLEHGLMKGEEESVLARCEMCGRSRVQTRTAHRCRKRPISPGTPQTFSRASQKVSASAAGSALPSARSVTELRLTWVGYPMYPTRFADPASSAASLAVVRWSGWSAPS